MDLVKEINDFYYHMALYELQVMNGNDYYNGLSYNSLLYINVMEQMEDNETTSGNERLYTRDRKSVV